jgi:2-keto-4-pentenoate hydratase/2-oxohepta-3-ene-1,7-dioic acid hydratase in catechol pathway
MKSPGAVQDPGAPIELPTALASHQVDYEAELAVVIGRRCKNVGVDEALASVLGYTCANDVSARDWQKRPELGGGQWCRGKSFDTFAPLGPVLVSPSELPDPNALAISTDLNGERVQDGHTSDMIFSVAEIIAFLSGSTTLLPGTVILTGTPEGVGMAPIHPAGSSLAIRWRSRSKRSARYAIRCWRRGALVEGHPFMAKDPMLIRSEPKYPGLGGALWRAVGRNVLKNHG